MTTEQEQQKSTMKCIEDGHELEASQTSGEPSMRCPVCSGAWLTDEVLHAVEDKSFDPEMVKGQMRYGEHPTEHACPHCEEKMTRFRYRGHSLEIEACPNGAGYWLDHGEDKHIKDALKDRKRGLLRSHGAQRDWHRVRRGESGSIMDRIRRLFNR
jgi:Zn-finger nucleic acid-binding protein